MPTNEQKLAKKDRPIPAVAKAAIVLAQANHQRFMNELAEQTLEAMNLSSKDGWQVFLDEGVARQRETS